MEKATLEQGDNEDSTECAADEPVAVKARRGPVKSAPMPRPTTAIEAFALRSLNESDAEFARYLIKFLRDFSAVSRKAAESSPLRRALLTSSLSIPAPEVDEATPAAHTVPEEPAQEAAFRVPPFAAALAEDSSTIAGGLEPDSPVAPGAEATSDDEPIKPSPKALPRRARRLPYRPVA